MADLIELDLVYIEVIFCMERHGCYALVNCSTRVVKFKFPNKLVLEWQKCSVVPKGQFILYLKKSKLVSKGCVYRLVRVNDFNVDIPPI